MQSAQEAVFVLSEMRTALKALIYLCTRKWSTQLPKRRHLHVLNQRSHLKLLGWAVLYCGCRMSFYEAAHPPISGARSVFHVGTPLFV